MRLHVLFVLAAGCASDREPTSSTAQALYIDDVFACGTEAEAGNLDPGTELQRVDIDLGAFPDARCNDGTAAVFYFRPASTVEAANRWVIQLQGGGGCRTPDDCARRWCSIGTYFGMTQMTSNLAPAGAIDGDGILYRGPQSVSPFEEANHVFIRYCSSDLWSGREGPLTLTVPSPIGGPPISYELDFRGADILDAVIAMLRQDGVPGLIYTRNGIGTPLTDLDAAARVVLAGASAGGGGVINNGDRIHDLLLANDLDGVLDYRLLIDSLFPPNAEDLDWNFSPLCTQAVCDWSDIFLPMNTMFTRTGDESCETWHTANAPGTEWQCDDTDHVVRHHVLSPMMVRMGLIDSLLSENLIEANVFDGAGNQMTLPLFADLVHDQLLALPDIAIPGLREETAPTAPAIYGPECPKHETLSNNASTFNTRIGELGVPMRMFDVWSRWVAGAPGSQVVFDPGDPQVCF